MSQIKSIAPLAMLAPRAIQCLEFFGALDLPLFAPGFGLTDRTAQVVWSLVRRVDASGLALGALRCLDTFPKALSMSEDLKVELISIARNSKQEIGMQLAGIRGLMC